MKQISDTNLNDNEIVVSKMTLEAYQEIAFSVILKIASDGSAFFESQKDDAIARNIFKSLPAKNPERVKEIIRKSDRPEMSFDDFVEGYAQRHLSVWLQAMSLSKMPVVVSEINGFHLIAAIKGKGFADSEIDTTDFVLSNYLHEIAVVIRECNPKI